MAEEAITITVTNQAITREATEYATEAFTRELAGAANDEIAS